eukprot:TRINITY_DN4556_c0_g1_i1.p1 TRINITY_DN4556_c0_g1~~TRINITY_DN4556_c0_g1_i1.p1  ORF type:complete len:396 (-),score=65.07 TRINITY_DN4556_c0_g1_i1:69-1256(-)
MERGFESELSDIFNNVSTSLSLFKSSVLGLFEEDKSSQRRASSSSEDDLGEWTLLDKNKQTVIRLSESSEEELVDDEEGAVIDPQLIQEIATRLSAVRIDVPSLITLANQRGIPPSRRAIVYQLFLGFLSPWPHAWSTIPSMKQGFYGKYKKQYLGSGTVPKEFCDPISSDLKRTVGRMFSESSTIEMLERVTYICVKECLLDNYPRGLATISIPFLYSLLEELYPNLDQTPNKKVNLQEENIDAIESKLFWMMYLFCEDHKAQSIFEDPMAIVGMISQMVPTLDNDLHVYLSRHNFSYDLLTKWVSTFFVHRFRSSLYMLLWGKYMTNLYRLPAFHASVCASFLVYHADHLKSLSGPEIIQFIQHPIQTPWKYGDMKAFLELVEEHSQKLNDHQ